MVALSELDKSRVFFHLGMGVRDGVDAGDLAQVEKACNTIPDEYTHLRTLEQLDICDEAFELSRMTRGGNRFTTREQYAGDLTRAITRENAKDFRVWQENYLAEVRNLAQLLWVPNYRDEGMLRYRFERSAGAFINAIPGPADTAVASRRAEFVQLAGGFGF